MDNFPTASPEEIARVKREMELLRANAEELKAQGLCPEPDIEDMISKTMQYACVTEGGFGHLVTLAIRAIQAIDFVEKIEPRTIMEIAEYSAR